MSTPPTAPNRDLVLSDEDLAEKLGEPVAYLLHEGMGNYALVDARECDLSLLRRLDPKPLYRRPIALIAALTATRQQIEAVRAAIEGRTSVNVSVILSALGERGGESDHVIPDQCRDGCEHETLPADGPPVEEAPDTAPHRRSFDICSRCLNDWPCPTVSALGEQE